MLCGKANQIRREREKRDGSIDRNYRQEGAADDCRRGKKKADSLAEEGKLGKGEVRGSSAPPDSKRKKTPTKPSLPRHEEEKIGGGGTTEKS